jgi:hypothetical protein
MNDDLENVGGYDIIRISPLAELSTDLITENIKSQIENPYTSRVDFLQQFAEEYEEDMHDLDEESDEFQTNNSIAREFYSNIIELIDKRFGLEIDYEKLEDLNLTGIRNIAEGLYTFFILKYQRNISKYISKMIYDHEDELVDDILKDGVDTDNVSYASWNKKLSNKRHVHILSNINRVIHEVASMDIELDDFIQYFNTEKFEVAVIKIAIENFIIQGSFVKEFTGVVFANDLQNDIYDDIVCDVQHFLYKKYCKKDKLSIEMGEPEEYVIKEQTPEDEDYVE